MTGIGQTSAGVTSAAVTGDIQGAVGQGIGGLGSVIGGQA